MDSKAMLARIQRVWARFYAWCSSWMDAGLQALAGKPNDTDGDFDANADWAIAEQTPRGARVVVWLSCATVLVLLLWVSK